ncbi:MAG: cell envelope biogenesis protein TolA [Hyphomicrobiales bacterium]|nr:cell envelope biogenesis protein TolA [Hyphomicrobiales bacterium]
MARKLKTYQTSIGFYDLAVAAPSMKAALEIWGADSNLFHQGFAREVDGAAVVAATLAQPGTVLRRPVGTDGAFRVTSDLPKDLVEGPARTRQQKEPTRRPEGKTGKPDGAAARKSAAAFDQQQRKREQAQRRADIAEAKQRERRSARIAEAQQALDAAKREHDAREAALQAEREKLDKRADAERQRWEKQRDKLRAGLNHAKEHR